MIDRRDFLGLASGVVLPAAAVSVTTLRLTAAERTAGDPGFRDPTARNATHGGPAARDPALPAAVGIQLYTLRSLMSEDPVPVLAELSAIGYEEVELAGAYGRSARELRFMLDDVGLRATSGHQSLETVRTGWDQALEDAQELGQRLIVVPSLPGDERDAEGLRRVSDDFNRAGEAASRAGIRFGYHNHDWELRRQPDGLVPMDLLLAGTDPALVDWQMDIYWMFHGGADPVDYLARHPGRVTSFHVKDRDADGAMVDVGAGVVDFTEIFRAAGDGFAHAYVEHDSPPDPMETARTSFSSLRATLDSMGMRP
ncbi:MAG: sugar phosphate isomerase/epimerase [Gemmatimonadetes bacterium]|nr:sugar phosphate isomerase/epimerase [Gemmatimonadota bacterium]